MVLLGDASYSIYLIHNPLLSITSRIAGKFHNFASWGLGMLVGVAASVVIGVLYHLFLERP
jgi:peptidoglycan/LPS O-acetylase OafA/YrhL